MLPLPECSLFALYQCSRSPSKLSPQSTSAFSRSTDASLIDFHARPPIVRRVVNCMAVDWLLNRKFSLKWQWEAVFKTAAAFSATVFASFFFFPVFLSCFWLWAWHTFVIRLEHQPPLSFGVVFPQNWISRRARRVNFHKIE